MRKITEIIQTKRLTMEEVKNLAQHQRPGVKIIVGPTVAIEKQMAPLPAHLFSLLPNVPLHISINKTRMAIIDAFSLIGENITSHGFMLCLYYYSHLNEMPDKPTLQWVNSKKTPTEDKREWLLAALSRSPMTKDTTKAMQ